MAIEIGSQGLVKAKLTIPQGCSVSFTVIHKDDAGSTIDHSSSTGKLALQDREGRTKKTYDLSSGVTCGSSSIVVSLPPAKTAEIPVGKYFWDLIVAKGTEKIRLLYGDAEVVDTYALD